MGICYNFKIYVGARQIDYIKGVLHLCKPTFRDCPRGLSQIHMRTRTLNGRNYFDGT